MGSTIVLSKKLQKAWTEDKVDSKSSEVKTNPNTVALRKVGISEINDYYNLLIKKMNDINSKYKVNSIKFVDEPVPAIGSRAINAGLIEREVGGEKIPLAYVFVSNPNLGSRNIFGSQQLFPGLSYLVNHYIGSPSYELANLPIYFVNGSTDNVTESMQETIMAMSLMGVRYVQVFNEETLPAGVFESDLIGFSRFITNDTEKRAPAIIHTDFYELDSNKKKIVFTTTSLKEDNIDSFGSSDRFFVIKAYPALILADEEMYDIDVSRIEVFLSTYRKGKNNLEPFIKFAKKLEERERV